MFVIDAQKRNMSQKPYALRKGGSIPAVYYGAGKKSTSVSISTIQFKKIWRDAGESSAVVVKTPEGDIDALIYEVQVDPVTDEPIHVDFLAIDMTKKIKVKVPLEYEGVSDAVKNGLGNLVKVLHEVEVEALPKDLPHSLHVDISKLVTLEDNIFISDIKLPAGVVIVGDTGAVVASIVQQVEEKEEEVPLPDLSAIEVEKKGKKEEEAPTPEGVGVPASPAKEPESIGREKKDKK